jgi:hypothetical protein
MPLPRADSGLQAIPRVCEFRSAASLCGYVQIVGVQVESAIGYMGKEADPSTGLACIPCDGIDAAYAVAMSRKELMNGSLSSAISVPLLAIFRGHIGRRIIGDGVRFADQGDDCAVRSKLVTGDGNVLHRHLVGNGR